MPCYYPETADKYLKIFNELQIADLLNTPKIKDLPQAWYSDFVLSFFGCIDLEKRERLIQEFFVLIPKKNAKSTISGLIMLAVLIANPYQGAEFALIAASKEVVNNAFIPIAECIRLNKGLSQFLKITDGVETKQIKDLRTGAVLRITTPLMKTNQGKKWQGVLIDEIALWQDIKNSVSILNEISGNLINKKDSFIIYLTTQSHEPPKGVFKALLEKARRINQQGEKAVLSNKFLPILYEFSEKEIKEKAYLDPKNWHKVNPNLGVSVDIERLKIMQADAIKAGREAEKEFYAKYLNIEIQIDQSQNIWQGADFWLQNEKTLSLKTILDKSDIIYIGIDGGGLDDLTGLAVLGIDNKGFWRVWCFAYGYDTVLQRAGLAARLKEYQIKGECLIVDKIGQDSEELEKTVKKIYDTGKVSKIGIDPRGVGDILGCLKDLGIQGDIIENINQGVYLQSADITLQRRLAQNSVAIARSELMRFCVSNAIIETRGDDTFLSKKSSQFKIDPLMALLNCVALFERYGDKKQHNFTANKYANALAFIQALKR